MAHPSPTPVDRKLYGPLVDDVYVLRAAGHDVSRFKGDYRVGKEVVTAAGLRGLAAAQRARQQALAASRKPDSPRSKLAGHAIEPSSETAGGTPSGESDGTPVASRTGGALAKHSCTKCGGPRSKWSTALCRACYVPAGRAKDPAPPSADVRDKFARITSPSPHGGRDSKVVGASHQLINSNAAQDGRADVIDVPPGTTPQTEALQPASVTPAHDAGELGAGTIQANLQGRMANAGDGGETAATRGRPSPLKSQAVTKPPNAGGSNDAGLKTRRQEVARVVSPAVLCPCGRPKASRHGRCWARRGLPGPVEPVARGKHPAGVCEACGGPRSYWARSICRRCHRAKVTNTAAPGKVARDANNTAIWAEIDALKSAVERMRVQLAMEMGR